MSQNEFVTMLEAASKTECRCKGKTATILIKAVWNNCLKCCSKYIKEAGKVVNGTTALIEAITWRHFDIVGLLLPIEGSIKDQDGKPAIYYAAKYCRELFDDVLKNNAPGFYDAIQEMRGRPCVCSARSESVKEALKNECMRCCGLLIREAGVYLDEAIAEVKAVAACRSLIPVKIMRFLQTRLGVEAGCTELILAIRNNLYDAAILLVDEQRDLRDQRGRKASLYAVSVHNPRLWALFPEDITKDYAADLEAAHSSECICDGESESLGSAIEKSCLKCCVRYITHVVSARWKYTELLDAVRRPNIRIVRLLMHVQARFQDNHGKSALMFAASCDNLPAVELLAQREARLQDEQGLTAIMLASKRGHTQVVEYLIPLEAGMRDNFGRTALVHAILRNRPDTASVLLASERDIRDTEGLGPEDHAFRRDNIKLWQLFYPNITQEEGTQRYRKIHTACTCQFKSNTLVEAARLGCVRCCKRLIGMAGKIVKVRTALMEAAERDHVEVVKLLMKAEAGMQNQAGETALILGVRRGHLEIVKLLLPHEAGRTTYYNKTALGEAVLNFRKNCVDLLRQSPEEVRASKVTRAMLAAYDGDVKAVLQNHREWGSVFGKGLTVLDFAFLHGRPTFIRALMRDHASRKELASGSITQYSSNVNIFEIATRSNTDPQHLKHVLSVLCAADQKTRSLVMTKAMFDFYRDEACAFWGPFCSPRYDDLKQAVLDLWDERRAMRGFARLRHAGVLGGVECLRMRDAGTLDKVRAYLARDPIKAKQIELARKEAKKSHSGEERKSPVREMEAEASFNRNILLGARDVWCAALPARKLPPLQVGSLVTAKLTRNAVIIREAYLYLYLKVQEILGE